MYKKWHEAILKDTGGTAHYDVRTILILKVNKKLRKRKQHFIKIDQLFAN